MRCNYCYSEGRCHNGCQCAKCVDPEDYNEWKINYPEEYEQWIEGEKEEEEHESDYDKELAEIEEREFLEQNEW